jgi:peptide/nickel transport system ATP-binding protein
LSIATGGPDETLAGRPEEPPVLEAMDLHRYFKLRRQRTDLGPRRVVHAVDGVSIALRGGSAVALVGESGSGKSTLARLLAQLEPPTAGEVKLQGRMVHATHGRALRKYCGSVQYVFQDPFAALNPVYTVRHHLQRPLRIRGVRAADLNHRLAELLDLVHLVPAGWFLPKFPHELSGGQLQRIGIARALAADPVVLLADEPVSMLDVSIRIGVLNLLQELQEQRRIAVLYVTHDMASARYFAQSTLVMYAGQLVEGGPSEAIVHSPAHPYTQLLIESAPDPDRTSLRDSGQVNTNPPDVVNPPLGCRFAPRCPHAMPICAKEAPPAFDLGEGQWAKCWLHAPN